MFVNKSEKDIKTMTICNIGFVSGGKLNLRKNADTKAAILKSIPDGTLLMVNRHDNHWYSATYGKMTGFVMRRYVTLLNLSNAVQLSGIIEGGELNMRRDAHTTAECLMKIPDNTTISIINFDFKGLWYIAEYNGYVGYVIKERVAVIEMKAGLYYGQTRTDDLNIRKEPRRSAARWNNVWPENRITLVKTVNENWYETLYRGEQAFVSAEFITLLDCEVPSDIVQRMLYMVKPEIGRVNSVYFNGYTGQWCHRFADWLAMHAGTPKNLIPNTSNCGKGIVWFVNDAESGGFCFMNAEHKARMISNYSAIRHLPKELTEEEEAYTPSPGDYIYFRWRNAAKDVNVSHVGIVSGVSEDKLTTVEGNAGGAVANRSYALNDDRIVGYGKPRYDAVG